MPISREDVQALLREPVPPSGSAPDPRYRAWHEWQARWRQVGIEHAAVCVDALENADEPEQYAALLALPLLGFEAWANGYGADLVYEVTAPAPGATKRIIKPRITPAPDGAPR